MNEITVYSRRGCHLCEVLLEELEPMCRAASAPLRILDVDADPTWCERYGMRVPVVCAGDEELCAASLDRARVAAWLGLS